MKLNATILNLILIGFCCTGCATPTVKFTVNVTDLETGEALLNAEVHTTFDLKYDPWGGGDNKVLREKRVVDENGSVTFENADVTQNIGTTTFCDTYYPSDAGFEYTGINRILNRWEPWNPTIEVKMRKIKDPVPMIYKSFIYKDIPNGADKFSFDFEIGDWVRPYGNGINSDIIVFYEKIEKSSKNDGGIQYTIKFPNALDGIQSYKFKNNQSTYEWPYVAPLEGYTSQLNKKYIWNFNGTSEGNIDRENQNDTNYIFRIRSKKDENGKITGMYGRIKNDVKILSSLTIEYWLNTDPNSRSLEYKDE